MRHFEVNLVLMAKKKLDFSRLIVNCIKYQMVFYFNNYY